jgi:hypothetical protein
MRTTNAGPLVAAGFVFATFIGVGNVAKAEPATTVTAAEAARAYAVSRMLANTQTMHRERNARDAAVKVVTGISPRDIRSHGILGGPRSEPNRILNRIKRIRLPRW